MTGELRAWREVLPPREDVAAGRFHAAEFAADLHAVTRAAEAAADDYRDPVEFFRRTCLTTGLRDLLGRAVRRLAGADDAPPVVDLHAGFGAGKTHAMLGLWHLAGDTPLGAYPREVQDLLADRADLGRVRRAAVVGQHLAPTGAGRGARRVHTLWGELARQLGGQEAYALVAESDRAGTSPGGALRVLLARHAPAVVLIDEWAAYARQLPDEPGGRTAGGTLGTQLTFAQSLTEAVAATPGVLLVVALPGGAGDAGGPPGLEAVERLRGVIGRIADPWRPASDAEAHQIVRQRLFASPGPEALGAIDATARSFGELYRRHADAFPREATDDAYVERIRQSYPLHPELLDRLDEDWSGALRHPRGRLRLLNALVHDLWVAEDPSPLVMPGGVPIARSAFGAELARHLPDRWQDVIDVDVDGPSSEPVRLDGERPVRGRRSLTTRFARTVLLGSAPELDATGRGVETSRVVLGTAAPGDRPGDVHAALAALSDRATYFYSAEGRHWYDVRANVTRRARDRAEAVRQEDVWSEIVRRLRGQVRPRDDFAAVHVCPADSSAIPDRDEVRLVVLHPRLTHTRRATGSTATEFVRAATESRGSKHRTFRTMVVFLAADADRMGELDHAVRDHLAWSAIAASHDLDLTPDQRRQARQRRRIADQVVAARLLLTYQWVLVPEQADPDQPYLIAESRIPGSAGSLAERAGRRLRDDARLQTVQAAAAIRAALDQAPTIWGTGHVSLGELWRLCASYPYLPRLRDRSVLDRGVRDQPTRWQAEGFALAEGFDGERYAGLVVGDGALAVPLTDDTLLVRPDVAMRQLGAEPQRSPDVGVPDEPPRPTRFSGTTTVRPDRCARELGQVAEEVIAHLVDEGVRLTVRVEIEAASPAGFDASTVRTISENAATLRFDRSGFEEPT